MLVELNLFLNESTCNSSFAFDFKAFGNLVGLALVFFRAKLKDSPDNIESLLTISCPSCSFGLSLVLQRDSL
jgi:hypothetical protein